ncbi:cold and drought-regulated protein CORA-like [Herrania umbratica]|uniref:Cold and drought-regulated protein CORA-like n=1 Tax=Herrania umbratica TaxID=108875 RepID=A0A6J1BN76_9ROSI|nr:cold and drought-regulated protein CORA-like [Herrania umbratica]
MKFKQFIFLALLFTIFLLSSAAVAEKSEDETKPDATEERGEGDEAMYFCRHRCCGHYGCRCCSYAEAQLMGAQAKDEKSEVAQEVNQADDGKYYRCRYRCCGPYGCRCCTFAGITAEELNQQNNLMNYQGSGYGGGGYGGGRVVDMAEDIGGGGGHGGYGGGSADREVMWRGGGQGGGPEVMGRRCGQGGGRGGYGAAERWLADMEVMVAAVGWWCGTWRRLWWCGGTRSGGSGGGYGGAEATP